MSFYFEALWYTSNCTKKYQVKSHVLLTHLLSFGCTDDVSYPRNDFPKTIPSVPEDLHFTLLAPSQHPVFILKKSHHYDNAVY